LRLHHLQGLLDVNRVITEEEEITEEGRALVVREETIGVPGPGVRLVVKMEGRVQRKEALAIEQLAVSLTMEKKTKSTAATVASLKLSPMVGMPPKGSRGKI
jgi:hypothetical protein